MIAARVALRMIGGAALAAALPGPGLIAHAHALPAHQGALRAKAIALAKVLNSEEMLRTSIREQFFKGIHLSAETDPAAKAIEQRFPGFFDELGEAVLPFFTDHLLEKLPALWGGLADYFEANFTASELDKAIAFYSSPAGQHVIEGMYQSMKADTLTANARANHGTSIDDSAVKQTISEAAPNVIASLGPEDLRVLLAFSGTSAGIKISKGADPVRRITVDWMNEVLFADPAFKQEVLRQTITLVRKRTDDAEAKASGE